MLYGILGDDQIRDADTIQALLQAPVLPIDELIPMNRQFGPLNGIEKFNNSGLIAQFKVGDEFTKDQIVDGDYVFINQTIESVIVPSRSKIVYPDRRIDQNLKSMSKRIHGAFEPGRRFL